jgi:CRP-like cAMP-binding protein
LRATPRTATVKALTDMSLYAIDRTSFLSAITGQPPEALEDSALRVERGGPDPSTRPLAEVLSELTLLRELDSDDLDRLAGAAMIEDWEPGAVIVREGEPATALFVLLSGRAQAMIDGRKVGELWPGDGFGEIAILHRVPRTATVLATEATRTCRIPAETVVEAVEG